MDAAPEEIAQIIGKRLWKAALAANVVSQEIYLQARAVALGLYGDADYEAPAQCKHRPGRRRGSTASPPGRRRPFGLRG